MLVDQDMTACKGHAQRCFLQLPDMIGKLDRVVFGNGSLMLDGEYPVQIVMVDGHKGGSRFGCSDSELAVELGDVGLMQKRVGFIQRLNPS